MANRMPNFNAGPAAMPESVLKTLQNDLLDYRGTGLSVLEMSHRSSEFAEIAGTAEQNLKTLLGVPDDYSVLFMQGGASAQFSLCVQNLDVRRCVAYANTGYWSQKAMQSAQTATDVIEATGCVADPLQRIPLSDSWKETSKTSFVHITDNETIDGITFHQFPEVDVPVVADMSSSILSRPVDIKRYGMIYAGAQKNIGPAGITVLIISNALLERSATVSLPPVFSYAAMASAGSMLNTPPTFAWYAAGLVFEWLLERGGLETVAAKNVEQAQRLYAVLDEHPLFVNDVHPDNRSLMNIPFQLSNPALTETLLTEAGERGLVGLKGHKSVGGLRASLYNAVPDESVDALIACLDSFAQEHA